MLYSSRLYCSVYVLQCVGSGGLVGKKYFFSHCLVIGQGTVKTKGINETKEKNVRGIAPDVTQFFHALKGGRFCRPDDKGKSSAEARALRKLGGIGLRSRHTRNKKASVRVQLHIFHAVKILIFECCFLFLRRRWRFLLKVNPHDGPNRSFGPRTGRHVAPRHRFAWFTASPWTLLVPNNKKCLFLKKVKRITGYWLAKAASARTRDEALHGVQNTIHWLFLLE